MPLSRWARPVLAATEPPTPVSMHSRNYLFTSPACAPSQQQLRQSLVTTPPRRCMHWYVHRCGMLSTGGAILGGAAGEGGEAGPGCGREGR